ncbi:MAG: PAS domain S-box protein [Gammaproteobacteria bacterium]|nr:PAS domain S-box protein [Gammaproteobacteria bacterium]
MITMARNKAFTIGSITLLSLCSLLGNWMKLPLFFGVDFIFGSVAVMLAIVLFGTIPALIVAFFGGIYTFVLWGHPYALVIFFLEAFVIAFIYYRGLKNLTLSGLIYWLCIGMPLVMISYQFFLGMNYDSALLIAFKQALNGIFNALIAGIIIIIFKLNFKIKNFLKLSTLKLQELLFHIILLTMLLTGFAPIIHESYTLQDEDEFFIQKHLMEEARRIETLYQKDTFSIENIHQYLNDYPLQKDMGLALIHADGTLAIQIGDIKSLDKSSGKIKTLDVHLKVWMPNNESSIMKRWKQGRYFIKTTISNKNQSATLLIEEPTQQVIQRVEKERLILFYFLAAMLLIGISFAYILSRWLSTPLNYLKDISIGLTEQIEQGIYPKIPTSAIEEYAGLSGSLQEMSSRLVDSFYQLKNNQKQLEIIVEERTKEVKRLSEVARQTTNGVVITDEKGFIEWVNEGFTRITGYSLRESYGKKPGSFLQGEQSNPSTIKYMSRSITENHSFVVDLINYSKLGEPYWVNINCNPLYDNDKNVYGFIAIETDISLQKATEQALTEQAKHTQAILDNMLDGIITINEQGKIVSINPAAESIFKYKEQEVIGKNVNIFMPEPHHSAHDSYLKKYHETGKAAIIGIGREVEAQRKDGTLFPMDLTISEITRQGKRFFIGKVTDISERKHIEKMKNEFVSVVSHELRTPLTSISGSLGLIAGGVLGKLPDKVNDMISIAHKNSQRLTLMINDLLDIEKLAAGKMHFDMKVQYALPLIKQSISANQNYSNEKNVQLLLDQNDNDFQINVDEQRFMQVMSNLLSNAIKYSPENDIVQISVKKESSLLNISVKDNGPGISDEFKQVIFEKFAQADSSDTRQKGGTGLGLAITKELVENMNGSIGFESEQSEGSKFYFSLPIYSSHHTNSELQFDNIKCKHQTILIIEDEPDIAHILSTMLQQEGYQTNIAYNGEEALKLLDNETYTAVTLDLVLPDMNGLDIIKKIRNQPNTSKLPIIVISAKMQEGKLEINGDFSNIEWLAKPIKQELLINRLEEFIDKKQQSNIQLLFLSKDTILDKAMSGLENEKIITHIVSNVSEAEQKIMNKNYDVFIIDSETNYIDIMSFIGLIKTHQKNYEIILLASDSLNHLQKESIEMDLFNSVISFEELLETIKLRIN